MPRFQSIPGPAARTSSTAEPRRIQIFVPFQGVQATAIALRQAAAFLRDLGGTIRIVAPVIVPYPLPLDKPDHTEAWLVNQIALAICRAALPATECTAQVAYVRDRPSALRGILPPHCIAVVGRANGWLDGLRSARLCRLLRRLGHEVLLARAS